MGLPLSAVLVHVFGVPLVTSTPGTMMLVEYVDPVILQCYIVSPCTTSYTHETDNTHFLAVCAMAQRLRLDITSGLDADRTACAASRRHLFFFFGLLCLMS